MSENNIDLWQIVERNLVSRSGSLSKNISYLEYMVDLVAIVLKDVASTLPQESITLELQAKLNILSTILEHSSINLDNILNNPLESWKIQGIIDLKIINTELRQLYLSAKLGI